MRVLISMEHPAWVHQFRHLIQDLRERGDELLVLAVKKDGDTELLNQYNIPYRTVANTTGKNIAEKGFLFLKLCIVYTLAAVRFKPDILVGRASPMMAVAAAFVHKPHVIFEDTEVSRFSLNFCRQFSSCIITPVPFLGKLGKKHRRLPIYKELFYLHPSRFSPDKKVLRDCEMDADETFLIVRFVSWNASHDVGKTGLTTEGKIQFVKELAKHVRVYISSEGALPEELLDYRLPIPFHQIHHALYYASLVLSEGATMASEAAMLGTYAFYLNSIESGTTNEQSERFGLLRVLHDPDTRYDMALKEALELLEDPELKKNNKLKQAVMLKNLVEPNHAFMCVMKEFLNDYSLEE